MAEYILGVMEEWDAEGYIDLEHPSFPSLLAVETGMPDDVRKEVYRRLIEDLRVNPHTDGSGCFCCWDCGSHVKDLDGLTNYGQCSATAEAIIWGTEDMGVLEEAGVDLYGCDPMGNTILDFATADLRCVLDESDDSVGDKKMMLKKVLDYNPDLTRFWLTRLTKNDDGADVGYVRPLVKAIRRDLEEEDNDGTQELAFFKTMVLDYGADVCLGRTLDVILEILDKSTSPRTEDLRCFVMEYANRKEMMRRMYYVGKAREQDQARKQYLGKLRNRNVTTKRGRRGDAEKEIDGVIVGLMGLSEDVWKDFVIQWCI